MKVKIVVLYALLSVFFVQGLWAMPDLSSQGDDALKKGDFRSAEAIYKRAMELDERQQELLAKSKHAALLSQCDDFLSQLDRQVQKKGDIRIAAQQVATLMAAGEPLTMVDIRTPQEQAFVIPKKAIFIQLPEIMQHLDQIPHEGTVVIVCHSSPRAIIAATALRILGYDNVYALKGGIMSIADINAKKAPDNL